jgi:hypothetical protein
MARQHLFPLRRLKRFVKGPEILKKFYSGTIESILTGCINAWYGNCSASKRNALQRVLRMPQYLPRVKLPAMQDLYTRRCKRKVLKIDCSLCYHMASGTDAPSLGPKPPICKTAEQLT